MQSVDTNVLVRITSRDHEDQIAEAERFIGTGAWVSQLVLVETVWVLSSVYGLKQPTLADVIERILDNRNFVVEEHDTVSFALAKYRRHPGVSFSDCLILENAQRQGHLPLGTFDAKLAKLEGTRRIGGK
jgi:predicted nucleic-acid-binding protein